MADYDIASSHDASGLLEGVTFKCCLGCGHMAGDHRSWWDDDNGRSGLACSRPDCDCDDLEG